jgi:hypothetical protein
MATAEELKILLTADNKASASVNKLRNDVTNLGKDAQKSSVMLATANGKITKSFAGLGRNAGMAGIQIQQFVGQVQGGVNPMIALSQQGADLGFVLGVPLVGAIVGIGSAIAMTLIPSLDEAEVKFKDLKNSLSGLTDDFKNMNEEMRAASIIVLVGQLTEQTLAYNEAVKKRKEAEAAQAAALEQWNKSTGYAAIKDARDELEKYNTVLNTLTAKEAIANGQRQETQAILDRVTGVTSDLTDETSDLTDEEQKQYQAQVDIIKALQLEAKTFGMTSIQKKRYKILTSDLVEAKKVQALALLDGIEAMEQERQKYDDAEKSVRKYQKSLKEVKIDKDKIIDVSKSMEDAFVGLINGTQSVSGAFKSMALSIVNDMIRMQMKSQTSGISQALNFGLNQMFSNGLNIGTAMEYSTNIGSQQTAMLAAQDFDGGGFTGYGGRSGGVDGKGGFPAILHPNETVIDHTKGQGGGQIVQNINVNTGVSQTVRAEIANLMPQIIRAAQSATADARMRGGAYSSAMGA